MPLELLVTGALNWDINLFVTHLPRSGQEVVVERIERVPGGKGGNVSVAAARILGPGRVALMACLGRDGVGKKQISILKQEGVDTRTVQILDKVESGQAYVTIDEKGANVIETHLGANARLTREYITEQTVQSTLGECSVMVVIDPPRRVAGKILSEGQRLERTVIWHPGVLTRFGTKEFEGCLRRLDYLILNEHEIALFANVKGLKGAIETVATVAPKTKIIVTLGKKGAVFYEKGKLTRVGNVSLAKLGRKVMNTTGSGDAFVGAFAAYKVLGKTDGEALRLANMAGALKASKMETRGSPSRHELEEASRKYFG